MCRAVDRDHFGVACRVGLQMDLVFCFADDASVLQYGRSDPGFACLVARRDGACDGVDHGGMFIAGDPVIMVEIGSYHGDKRPAVSSSPNASPWVPMSGCLPVTCARSTL